MGIKPNQLSPEPLPQNEYASAPATGAGKGAYGVKNIGGISEAVYVDSSGNEIQLTNAGSIATPSGSGEANTGVNLSTAGAGKAEVFSSKSGVALQFKRLVAGTNVTLAQDANTITISSSGGGSGEANTASNLSTAGAGKAEVFSAKVGVDLQFKRLVAGTNVTLAQDANTITISSSGGGGGEANTASNSASGTGTGLLFKGKVGVDLVFKKLIAGTNITLTNGTDDVTINATGGGSVSEFSFTLAAGADIATRVAGATGVPGGWTLAAADTAGIAQLGSSADTLVVTHGQNKIAISILVLELNAAGPAATQGYTQIDLTTQGVTKGTTDKNSLGILGLQPLTNSARALTVFVKLL
jgi:hypothetical protein